MTTGGLRLENRAAAWALALGDAVAATAADAALATLSYYPGIRIGRLANAVRLTHSGAVRLLDRLEGEGLVERRTGKDARTAAVFLTDRGRTAAERFLQRREQAVAALLAPLAGTDRRELQRLIDKLLAELPSSRPHQEAICRLCD